MESKVSSKLNYCDIFWDLYDNLCELEDLSDSGLYIDPKELRKARSELERHKDTCRECG